MIRFIQDWKEFREYKRDVIDKRRKREELFEGLRYLLSLESRYLNDGKKVFITPEITKEKNCVTSYFQKFK